MPQTALAEAAARERVGDWDEDNLSFSLFPYRPGGNHAATQFILGFKNSDPACVATALLQAYEALRDPVERWKEEFNCRYIVPVPGHLAHTISPSSAAMCSYLAGVFNLEYSEKLLFRKESTPPLHMARPWERLTPLEHFKTLGCAGINLQTAGVVLFDDVRTTGATSCAAKWRLQTDTGCGEVVRVFLGNTSI
jgi:predicted amidophosphoribosyltransferase